MCVSYKDTYSNVVGNVGFSPETLVRVASSQAC